MQHITKGVFESTRIPLAPPDEQQRIVAKIEVLFTLLDAGVASLKRVQAALKRYKAAVLKAACEGRLVPQDLNDEPAEKLLERVLAGRASNNKKPPKTEHVESRTTDDLQRIPSNWVITACDQVINDFRSGSTAVPQDIISEYPILRSSSIRPREIDFSDVRYLNERDSQNPSNFLAIGDLLFTRLSGSLEYVGNCALVRVPIASGIQFPDRIFRAKLSDYVSGAYLEAWFATPIARKRIMDLAKSTAGHQRISMDAIRQHRFALPPRNEQDRIVSEVDRRLSVVHELEVTTATNLARAERMRQSILKRAFEGRLVAQDAND